jgi:hypothetical protein
MNRFDKSHYNALLQSLDVTVLRLTDIRSANRSFRIDAQYFSKDAVTTEKILKEGKWETLGNASTRIDSFGAYALTNEFTYVEQGVPFLRCINIKDGFVETGDCLFISPEANNLLTKSAVRPGMVLLTMSGSVGEATVALPTWKYPVNSNQDVAKITAESGVNPYFLVTFLNCKYGRTQAERLPVGSVQQHIFLWMLEELVVLRRFSEPLEEKAAALAEQAYIQREKADTLQIEAETTLSGALGLQNWKPPEPLTYVRRASEVFAAHRLDSQYFAPRVAELIARLGTRGTLREVAIPRTERFMPANKGTFRYIEISDVNTDGTVSTNTLPMSDAPSRATWYVHGGDIVTSTVRPLRRLSAIVTPEQEGSIASSGFLVLEPREVPSEVLLTYLRLPNVCELMDLHTSASMYPAISDRDLLAMPFPQLRTTAVEAIVAAVRSSQAARRKAHRLLQKAKQGLEIAIEKSDSAALEFLSET